MKRESYPHLPPNDGASAVLSSKSTITSVASEPEVPVASGSVNSESSACPIRSLTPFLLIPFTVFEPVPIMGTEGSNILTPALTLSIEASSSSNLRRNTSLRCWESMR